MRTEHSFCFVCHGGNLVKDKRIAGRVASTSHEPPENERLYWQVGSDSEKALVVRRQGFNKNHFREAVP